MSDRERESPKGTIHPRCVSSSQEAGDDGEMGVPLLTQVLTGYPGYIKHKIQT